MGSQSVKPIQTKSDRKEFIHHLLRDIEALETMVRTGAFEKGIRRIGAEQELCIVDEYYRPSFNALKILDSINDDHFTTELGLFNIEANLDPLELKNDCFSILEKDLKGLLSKAHLAAKSIDDNKVILTGILPTFKRKDLVFENMTPHQRYKTLNDVMRNIRGDHFRVQVRGIDEVILNHESILFEACNTSFQVHLQVDLDNCIDQYNWSQAIAGPILSVMTNSPMLLGRELWSETRIALFQQSIDLRNKSQLLIEQKPRVSFGNAWVKDSILELFTDDVARYAPLVTTKFGTDSVTLLESGTKPKLVAMNLHNGTLYKWNRMCYGVHKNVAHLRIENRYIPSGPSVKDEIANAMFWVGVMLGMPDDYTDIWKHMEFKDAQGNFIKAARTGMDTYFNWFNKGISAKELALEILLPMAQNGLEKANVDKADIDFYLDIIKQRVIQNISGSKWQVRSSRKLQKKVSREESNILLTYHLHKNQATDAPVHDWDLATFEDTKDAYSQNKVYKVMSTQIFTVNQNDSVRLIQNIMKWKAIHHLPVIDKKHRVVGLMTSKNISEDAINQDVSIKEIMSTDIKTAPPSMTIEEAKHLMISNHINCLPIIDHGELVGLVTKTDLERLNLL